MYNVSEVQYNAYTTVLPLSKLGRLGFPSVTHDEVAFRHPPTLLSVVAPEYGISESNKIARLAKSGQWSPHCACFKFSWHWGYMLMNVGTLIITRKLSIYMQY
jgi:hypothetical protein